jgi:hypothetical protein
MPEVHVELLLGRKVVDRDGRPVGRIEEFLAERHGNECHLREVYLGPEALLRRFAVSTSRLPFLGWLAHLGYSCHVPWDRIDLSDPEHPRLTCTRDELASS